MGDKLYKAVCKKCGGQVYGIDVIEHHHSNFYEDGYFWFPTTEVKKINILGFFKRDISNIYSCKKVKACVRFLDEKCMIPDYLMAELNAKLIEQLVNSTKRLPEDSDINKNSNRLN